MLTRMRRASLFRLSQRFPHLERPLPRLPHPLPIDLARVAQRCHALSDVTRLHIVEMLSQRERSVGELARDLDVPQSSISFHLSVLKNAGWIQKRRDAQWRYYALRSETFEHSIAFIELMKPGKHIGTCPLSCCQEPLRWSRQL